MSPTVCPGYAPVLHAVQQLLSRKTPALIAIDGRCGSGKTTLAQALRDAFGCTVLHADDFYLPPALRAAGWQSRPAGNMDLTRLRREALLPARAGQAVQYRAYSCRAGAFAPPVTLPPQPLTVIEGSYCLHPSLCALYDLRIFLTCSPAEQQRRLCAREGAHMEAFQSLWIPLEEQYFRQCGLPARADLTLDTSDFTLEPPSP